MQLNSSKRRGCCGAPLSSVAVRGTASGRRRQRKTGQRKNPAAGAGPPAIAVHCCPQHPAASEATSSGQPLPVTEEALRERWRWLHHRAGAGVLVAISAAADGAPDKQIDHGRENHPLVGVAEARVVAQCEALAGGGSGRPAGVQVHQVNHALMNKWAGQAGGRVLRQHAASYAPQSRLPLLLGRESAHAPAELALPAATATHLANRQRHGCDIGGCAAQPLKLRHQAAVHVGDRDGGVGGGVDQPGLDEVGGLEGGGAKALGARLRARVCMDMKACGNGCMKSCRRVLLSS